MLKDGGTYTVPPDLIDNMRQAHPKVDVMAELNAMAGWLITNPTKRKTRTGMPRFINAWLKRAGEAGGSPYAHSRGQGVAQDVRTRDMTAMNDLTHNFTGCPEVAAYFTQKYGEVFDGRQVHTAASAGHSTIQGGRTVHAIGNGEGSEAPPEQHHIGFERNDEPRRSGEVDRGRLSEDGRQTLDSQNDAEGADT